MNKIHLEHTKQSKQINELRYAIEKSGWKIIDEVERVFNGKPRWETNDEIPNLIYSWVITRNPNSDLIWLDFIAHWDFFTYKTYLNDCSCCQIRDSEIEISFFKDRALRKSNHQQQWKDKLRIFLNELNTR